MRKAYILVKNVYAGDLWETESGFRLQYLADYTGEPISLNMPVRSDPYNYPGFPPFFDGLLPEGIQLEGLLKMRKIDRLDYFSQLLAVGKDMVGDVTVLSAIENE
jgi:serine/threonine-protein kinase HipA